MQNRTYRYYQGEALYPFGHGLSYTTFDIAGAEYQDSKVNVTVSNTGRRDGSEVIQVYVRNTADTEGPLRTLRAYQRVTLKAGEQQRISIDLPRERFEGWDTQTNTMRVVPGKYEVMVGTSSAEKDLRKIEVDVR
jgi:beta-glucosidase